MGISRLVRVLAAHFSIGMASRFLTCFFTWAVIVVAIIYIFSRLPFSHQLSYCLQLESIVGTKLAFPKKRYQA